MKRFEYTWTGDIFLLHIQMTNNNKDNHEILISRKYENNMEKEELEKITKDMKSHRFIVSRTHPREKSFTIDYPNEIKLEAFKVVDRAFYPTTSFYSN